MVVSVNILILIALVAAGAWDQRPLGYYRELAK